MNIVTRDQEINCDIEHGGDAYIPKWAGNNLSSSLKTPVNLVICSNNFGLFKLTSEVSASATHEFIHYLGLGHAFNKPNDFLCSIEKEGPTCSNVSFKSDSPSHFDLSGIKTLYFEDGWKSPNMAIYSSDEKFTAAQYMNFVTVDKPDIVSQTVPVEYYSDSAYFDETLYSDSHASVKNPSNLLPPLQQISRGVSSTDVICQNNFQKLYKPNGDPACISEKNLEKFTAKGWIR